jgi:small subunit ribosomal protein S6
MFLVSTAEASRDWDDLISHLHGILQRHGGKVLHTAKWDERRLAYEVEKQSRGVYILVHFQAPGSAIQLMQRDCQLSRRIIRVLFVIDEDGVPETAPEREQAEEAPAELAQQTAAEAAGSPPAETGPEETAAGK